MSFTLNFNAETSKIQISTSSSTPSTQLKTYPKLPIPTAESLSRIDKKRKIHAVSIDKNSGSNNDDAILNELEQCQIKLKEISGEFFELKKLYYDKCIELAKAESAARDWKNKHAALNNLTSRTIEEYKKNAEDAENTKSNLEQQLDEERTRNSILEDQFKQFQEEYSSRFKELKQIVTKKKK